MKLLTKLSNFTDNTVNSISIVDYDGALFCAMKWHSVDEF